MVRVISERAYVVYTNARVVWGANVYAQCQSRFRSHVDVALFGKNRSLGISPSARWTRMLSALGRSRAFFAHCRSTIERDADSLALQEVVAYRVQ